MSAALEREIKLRFDNAALAHAAVTAAGGSLLRERRLQRDCLLDTEDGQLRRQRSALRIRIEDGKSVITFKGPVQPSTMKLREELETGIDDGHLALEMLGRLGYQIWFRYEKYREEFVLDGCVVAVDETPVGTFIEIEGDHDNVARVARSLGRGPDDYLLDSYRGLFARRCEQEGAPFCDMLFDHD